MAYRLGIDVGGTFTDLLLHDSDTGRTWVAKTPSTPQDQSVGVLEGVRLIGQMAEIEPAQLDAILHGTTVATNAVLEKKGARVGLIVTEGYRHILHLAEAWTPGPLFGWMIYEKPDPIADVALTVEVSERIAADGTVVKELSEEDAARAVDALRDAGAEALTVTLINSYANPDHEQLVARVARERAPELPLSISSEIMPEFREYERAVTTVMNAYVAPPLDRYLSSLREGLSSIDARAGLQVVRSDGGLMSLDTARRMPVHTVLSGPAGGVSGAAHVAGRAGFDRIMTFDMGGTSTDVAVCLGGAPTITRETNVGDFPVRAPSVEVATIGAGGGSIAHIAEATGALRVGPQSAGADPGPACYGRGGAEPTVTDANVVLGHLPPRLLGGAMELDVEAAHAAVKRIADPLGLDVHAAAEGIVRIVNENMLGALRMVTVQKGRAPEDFALVSFGGAGGLHANALAALLGCYPVIVPAESGVLSALGFVASDVKNEFSQTMICLLDQLDVARLREGLRALGEQGRAWLRSERVDDADAQLEYLADLRYERQGFEIPVDLGQDLDAIDLGDVARRFRAEHERLYGFALDDAPELVNLRVVARGRVPKPELEAGELGPPDPSPAQRGVHVVHTEGRRREVPTYERAELRPGMELRGYAIVEQYDATTVVLPGHVATVDPYLNLLIRPEGRA
ncbi:MAG: hydantoinase/oxoprolinase family protein [Solirubrobacteraceae bacterium]|nr:hydantoinase/oxoprolinase family protein [Solirubrobacteraceae bacterium]